MTLISRFPRQIVGFAVTMERTSSHAQRMIDEAPPAKHYFSDGWLGYKDLAYPGTYFRNAVDKSDTHTVESINTDLREYIPMLQRRRRCFPRSIETLEAIMHQFVTAYNRFGRAKATHGGKRWSLPFSFFHFL
jgi:IS1 family transposase